MMKYLQKIGKSLMLPVACLPAAGILYGIGYWIDPTGWGANNLVAAFLIRAAAAVIDHIPLLFALGVSIGMAEDHDGTSALSGLVSWLMMTSLLSVDAVAMYKGVDVSEVPAAFGKIENAFIGILAGIIGSVCYNRFHETKLPDWLAFFSGKRCVAIVTAVSSILVSVLLYFIWPAVFGGLVLFGITIVGFGAVGSGIYAMLNRLLIPLGLHHALNAVFWFDTAGINDLGKFWSGQGELGVTGMYMTGFFPVTMFGLPAGALAMYQCAKTTGKKAAGSLLLAGSLACFFTGITEPLEFSFMFLAPGLYLVHAALTGILSGICTLLPVRCGFNFSAGFIDWMLSFKAPMAVNPWMVLPIGLVTAVIYYFAFLFVIRRFDLKTPGREEEPQVPGSVGQETGAAREEKTASAAAGPQGKGDAGNVTGQDAATAAASITGDKAVPSGKPAKKTPSEDHFAQMAEGILEGLGGSANIRDLDHCATRLRLEVADPSLVDETRIKQAGAVGVMRPDKNTVQVIIGLKVQFVYEAMKNCR